MNIFRSEEHVRNWADFKPGTEDGIIPIDDALKAVSGRFFTRRLDPDWFSRRKEYGRELVADLGALGKTGSFWSPRPPKE